MVKVYHYLEVFDFSGVKMKLRPTKSLDDQKTHFRNRVVISQDDREHQQNNWAFDTVDSNFEQNEANNRLNIEDQVRVDDISSGKEGLM